MRRQPAKRLTASETLAPARIPARHSLPAHALGDVYFAETSGGGYGLPGRDHFKTRALPFSLYILNY
jgi:hypothetical protein